MRLYILIAPKYSQTEEAKRVEQHLEALLLKQRVKAIPETESLVVRGLELESKALKINLAIASKVLTTSSSIREDGQ